MRNSAPSSMVIEDLERRGYSAKAVGALLLDAFDIGIVRLGENFGLIVDEKAVEWWRKRKAEERT